MRLSRFNIVKLLARKMEFGASSLANGGSPTSRKRLKSNGENKRIGTHNGTFHSDEALACFMLKLLPEYANAEIVRTRDQSILDACDIVVDVGGVYDPSTLRFDHHQKSFLHTFADVVPIGVNFKSIRLSSAGLIYSHFGREIIANVLNLDGYRANEVSETHNLLETIFLKCYERFVEEIDANDNGVAQHDDKAKFHITTTLPQRVQNLNPWWNAKEKNEEVAFSKAMNLAGGEFVDRVNYLYNCWWPARDLVKRVLEKRKKVDESGAIILFDQGGGCPWKEHLLELEEELGIKNSVKYAIIPDERNGNWMIICVPLEANSFQLRSPLPESWRGLRNEQLSSLIGIEKSIFCHATGFCGGHETKEGALQMVRLAMSQGVKGRPD